MTTVLVWIISIAAGMAILMAVAIFLTHYMAEKERRAYVRRKGEQLPGFQEKGDKQ